MNVVFIPVPEDMWINVLTCLEFPKEIIDRERKKLATWD